MRRSLNSRWLGRKYVCQMPTAAPMTGASILPKRKLSAARAYRRELRQALRQGTDEPWCDEALAFVARVEELMAMQRSHSGEEESEEQVRKRLVDAMTSLLADVLPEVSERTREAAGDSDEVSEMCFRSIATVRCYAVALQSLVSRGRVSLKDVEALISNLSKMLQGLLNGDMLDYGVRILCNVDRSDRPSVRPSCRVSEYVNE